MFDSRSERIGPRVLLPVAAAAAYLAALVLAALLPLAAGAVALIVLALLLLESHRADTDKAILAAVAFLPLHVLLAATGHFDSPGLPLLAGWAALVAGVLVTSGMLAVLLAAAALLALAALLLGALTTTGGIEASLALLVGGAAGLAGRRYRRAAHERRRAFDRLVGEAEVGADSPAADAARRRIELRRALDRMRADTGAERAVLWQVDTERERAEPAVVSGAGTPPSLVLRGDPLGWSLDERMPIRLADPPRWALASGPAWAVPVDADSAVATLLTVEFAPAAAEPAASALETVAANLRELSRAHGRELEALRARNRFRSLLKLLDRLAADIELAEFGERFTRAAAELAGATGAALASWNGETGHVAARVGEDGGPAVGAEFDAASEMGMTVRSAAPRSRRTRIWSAGELPVALLAERWVAAPRHLVVLPLGDAGGAIQGVLALWSSVDRELDDDGIEGLRAVAPFAGVQLRHATSYGTMREKAELDSLTGIPNRRAFDDRLQQEGSRSGRYRHPVSLILLDIDLFKSVNDTHGHDIGDHALRAVADVLRQSIRGSDFAARYGGEEFVVLLAETGLQAARETAERLRARVEALRVPGAGGSALRLTASLGVSSFPDCVGATADLSRSADAMLYAAKEAGRNRVAVAPLSHVLA